jgi:hypothetical protein
MGSSIAKPNFSSYERVMDVRAHYTHARHTDNAFHEYIKSSFVLIDVLVSLSHIRSSSRHHHSSSQQTRVLSTYKTTTKQTKTQSITKNVDAMVKSRPHLQTGSAGPGEYGVATPPNRKRKTHRAQAPPLPNPLSSRRRKEARDEASFKMRNPPLRALFGGGRRCLFSL